ncbi:MAG: DUF4082 domain-containing protein [Lacibacter sp.]
MKTLKCLFSTVFAFIISLTTLFAQADPNTGPGGPVLVIHSASNPFSNYTAEILRAEGLNEFAVRDISTVTAAILGNYDVVVLGEMTVTNTQVTMFSTWVNAGGVLIAFKPTNTNLRNLLGITRVGTSTLSNQYLLFNTVSGPGKGLVSQTIQFHGTADIYTLNGGTSSIATLYSDAVTATTSPAVTTRNVGANGGKAIAFTYDLCRSIVYTRQGNPAWAGNDRNADGRIQAIDMYFGAKVGDVQPDWVNFNKIQIPQADEQQRLLANIIIQSNQHKKPLPRFWYLPRDLKAAVVMSGDDHANGGTIQRFNRYKELSVSNTQDAVDDWMAIRSTSNIYPSALLTNAQAVAYQADGFEISMHLNTDCADYTAASLLTYFNTQLSQFTAAYPGLNATTTNRTHCAVWSDWGSKPTVQISKGIRLNMDYYYWPDTWVQNRPGLFTGSGLPMRLANTDGTIFDNYQLPTQITDESGINVSNHINTLLDNAIGTNGYYGVMGTQMHTDFGYSAESDDIIKAAQTRNIPVISAKQLLTWLDGRNNSSFGAFSWSGNQLSFTISAANGSRNLRAMLPKFTGSTNNLSLQSITLNGSPVSFSIQTIKGYQYAFFNGASGNYVATYASFTCTTPTATLVTVPTASCVNSSVSLQLSAATGAAPYSVVVNGVTYDNVSVGTPFATVRNNEISLWNAPPVLAIPNATDGLNPVELGTKFRSSVAGYVTGVQFYKAGLNAGTQVGKLYTSAGVLLASVSFTNANDASVGWKQARFSQPVYIQPNTTYVISYFSPSSYFTFSDFFFTSAFTNGPLTALQDGFDGANGLGVYGSGFPGPTVNARNYWVDVLFIPDINANQTINYTLTSITDLNGCNNTGANLSTAAYTLRPLPKGTIITETPGVCTGSNIRLIYTSGNTGTGPFQLTVNGNVYNNVQSGVAFSTGIIATLSTTLSLTTVTDNGSCSIITATPITLNSGSCGPLPVELISFNVTARQNDALLDWSTSTEINNRGFDVQRSKDATNWETIGFVKGVGQASAVNHYQYSDKGLAAGRYFYRLVQIDFNDKKSISAIKSITLNGQLVFDLKQNYPNPFNQSTVVEFTIPTRQNVLIGIYDIKGRLIQTLVNETRQKGTYTMQFNRNGLSAGMYYLKMETFEYKAVRKFVIE